MTDSTLYDLLGIQRGATDEEIRIAFHERARQLDRDQANPEAAQLLQHLRQAYQVLGDPHRRTQYDASLPPLPQPKEQTVDIAQLWKSASELFFQRSERFTPAIIHTPMANAITSGAYTNVITIQSDLVGAPMAESSLTC